LIPLSLPIFNRLSQRTFLTLVQTLTSFPDAGWRIGEIDDLEQWIDSFRLLPQTAQLLSATLELQNLMLRLDPLLEPTPSNASDIDDAPGDDEMEDGACECREAVTVPGAEVVEMRRSDSAVQAGEAPESSTAVRKGKGRAVEPAVQSETPSVLAVEKAPEPSIVVQRGKARELDPQPEDLEAYTSDGEPLIFNDPAVSSSFFFHSFFLIYPSS
jgi:hypothetical protein